MEWSVIYEAAPALLKGLRYTLSLSAVASLFALFMAVAVAWASLHQSVWIRKVAEVYTSLCLGLPLLVVIFLLFYVLPVYGITLEPETVGVMALAFYYAPYLAQVMVAALKTMLPGQREAAVALGLPIWRIVRRVWLPHALPVMLPPLTGLFIGLIKDSALLAMVSVPEFMFEARQAISETYAPLEIYLIVALTYWLINLAIEAVSNRLERHLTAYRRPTV